MTCMVITYNQQGDLNGSCNLDWCTHTSIETMPAGPHLIIAHEAVSFTMTERLHIIGIHDSREAAEAHTRSLTMASRGEG